jgi:LAO/AO transport system kinase
MNDLVQQIRSGNVNALARAISMVENNQPGATNLVRGLSARGNAKVVGITGPPGAGKSTLSNLLVKAWRGRDERVGMLAVDPSSPYTKGALLGDRVRLQEHAGDPNVFIRSMAARGHLGGLATALRDAIRLVAASDRDHILLETVGVGQSEIDVMRTADTTVVVVSPVTGDDVQIMKAGILEIADVFVVNKADVPDAKRVSRSLRDLVHQTHGTEAQGWQPPIVLTTATSGEGVDKLVEALDAHYEYLVNSGELEVRRGNQFLAEVEAIVASEARQRARNALSGGANGAGIVGDPDTADPYAVADAILEGGKTIE